MGTWGSGLLDNDTAGDAFSDIMRIIKEQIDQGIETPDLYREGLVSGLICLMSITKQDSAPALRIPLNYFSDMWDDDYMDRISATLIQFLDDTPNMGWRDSKHQRQFSDNLKELIDEWENLRQHLEHARHEHEERRARSAIHQETRKRDTTALRHRRGRRPRGGGKDEAD